MSLQALHQAEIYLVAQNTRQVQQPFVKVWTHCFTLMRENAVGFAHRLPAKVTMLSLSLDSIY